MNMNDFASLCTFLDTLLAAASIIKVIRCPIFTTSA